MIPLPYLKSDIANTTDEIVARPRGNFKGERSIRFNEESVTPVEVNPLFSNRNPRTEFLTV